MVSKQRICRVGEKIRILLTLLLLVIAVLPTLNGQDRALCNFLPREEEANVFISREEVALVTATIIVPLDKESRGY